MATAKTTAQKATTKKVVKPTVKPIETPVVETVVEVKPLTNAEIMINLNKGNLEVIKLAVQQSKLIKGLKYKLRTNNQSDFDKAVEDIEAISKKITKLLN